MSDRPRRYTGEKIGRVLKEQGRRQDWLAERVGVSPAAINRWVRGTRTVDHDAAVKIADALGVPLFLLFDVPIGSHSVLDISAMEVPA